ncbi:MAG: hypothetical protein Q4C04_05320 [Clostridia bacterium]|nr:hypothetical protein [Clostridia bacterium]
MDTKRTTILHRKLNIPSSYRTTPGLGEFFDPEIAEDYLINLRHTEMMEAQRQKEAQEQPEP